MRFWNWVRETEWYAVIAILLLAGAVALAVWTNLWTLAIVLAIAAVVAAVFSHRT